MISRITSNNYNVKSQNSPNFKSIIIKNTSLQNALKYAKANPTTEDSFFFFKSLHNLMNDGKNRIIEVTKKGVNVTVANNDRHIKNNKDNADGLECIKSLNNFAEEEKSFFIPTTTKTEYLFNKIDEYKELIEEFSTDLSVEMKKSLDNISQKLH